MLPIRIVAITIAAVAVHAQAWAAPEGSLNPAAFCRSDQAFGLKFGAVEQLGQHISVRSNLIPLRAQFRPFSIAEVVVSPRGRRRHTVHGQADFVSMGEAEDVLERLRASLIAQGWLVPPAKENGDQERSLYSKLTALNLDKPKGLVAELFTLGSRLYFSCTDAALAHQARREVRQPPLANALR